ncbi:MAG: glutamate racemase [Clostridiales bacterium]|nr:glutamate racemase [Clostridiales bacterium]
MDKRPIGIFDSGLGGLTCVPYLRQALPREKFIYFGDTARTPYGSKDPSTIRAFSAQIAEFLVQHQVKMIVIACNTVSSICLEDLQQRFPQVPIVGIIEPAAQAIADTCVKGSSVAIIGTKVTVKSRVYENLLKELKPELCLHAKACPAFVPLIEEGIIENEIMDLTIKHYLDDFLQESQADTLVLGCTHYPLIRKNIDRLYPDLRIINPSREIVKSVVAQLEEHDLLSPGNSDFENIFYASDLSENFVNMINRIFADENFRVEFRSVDPDARKTPLE